MKTRIAVIVASFSLAVGGLLLTGLTPAYAQTNEVCDIQGNCFNAWDGGPAVDVYRSGVANDNFTVEGVDRCNNGDYSTANCPIQGVPAGQYIYQVEYSGSGSYDGECVAAGSEGEATLSTCNDTAYPGNGGANGTILVARSETICHDGFNAGIDRYYTSNWSNPYGVYMEDFSGTPVELNSSDLICLVYL